MLKRFIKTIKKKLRPSETKQPAQKTTSTAAVSQPKRPPQERRRPAAKKRPREKKRPSSPRWEPDQFSVEPQEGRKRFHDFDIPENIMHAIYDLGFQYCTPIQAETLENTLSGEDTTGKAQTGTGKTAAFLIAVLTRLQRKPARPRPGYPRALIIAPTRELIIQISKDARALGKYTRLSVAPVYGGMDYRKQMDRFTSRPVDIVAATPGRLLDFMEKRIVNLSQVEILVIDEADRLVDMGFLPSVRRIVQACPAPGKRQTLFFSATITSEVERLAQRWTRDHDMVEIEPEQVAADTVDQQVFIVTTREKFYLLYNLMSRQNWERVLVFCNRRSDTRKLTERFRRYGISAAMLSGDVPQKKRLQTLEAFKSGKVRVLVATDVAGRGLHIDSVSHVVNYTLPNDPEDYVHRIGRTGRAGQEGISVSFACEEDAFNIPAIEEFLGTSLVCQQPEPELLTPPPRPKQVPRSAEKSQRPRHSGSRPPRRRPNQRRDGSRPKRGDSSK